MRISRHHFSRALAHALIATALLTGCAGPRVAVNPRADFSRIQRVAVVSFGGPAGDVAADLLTQSLLEHGAEVVERQRLESVMREHQLGADRILDPATIKTMGKILGVDAVFVGTVANSIPSQSYLVMRSEESERHEVTPLSGGTVFTTGFATGVPDSQIVTSVAQASLIARMVDVESGSILWSGRMSYEGLDVQETMARITSSLARSLVPLWPALHK